MELAALGTPAHSAAHRFIYASRTPCTTSTPGQSKTSGSQSHNTNDRTGYTEERGRRGAIFSFLHLLLEISGSAARLRGRKYLGICYRVEVIFT